MRRFTGSVEHAPLYDVDTGLYGKALFEILGDELVEQARRYGPALSLALYRTDWIDQAPAEPEIIREVMHYVGLLLVENLRQCDIAAHLGSGLFAVLLPHTPLDMAKEVSERMAKTIIGSPVILRSGDQLQILACVGVTAYEKGCHSLNDLIAKADTSLETALRNWRHPLTSSSPS